jgi:hypothetical protein
MGASRGKVAKRAGSGDERCTIWHLIQKYLLFVLVVWSRRERLGEVSQEET